MATSSYMTQSSCLSPELHLRAHRKPSFMPADSYFDSESFSKTNFNHETMSEDLIPQIYDNSQMFKCRNGTHFYPDKSNWILSEMSRGNETQDALEKMLFVSEPNEWALCSQSNKTRNIFIANPTSKSMPVVNIRELLKWKQCQDRKHERFMLEEQAMLGRDQDISSLVNRLKTKASRFNCSKHVIQKEKAKFKEQLCTRKTEVKPTVQKKAKNAEKPNCWHFIRGHCKRGKYCDFNHDRRHGYPDSFKVFLGGLPFNITEASLKKQLLEQGFNVVNKLRIYGGFSPQVCFASEAEAQRLVNRGSIKIGGMNVAVRCYQAFTKKNQDKLRDISRRSVFLGGIRKGTTHFMIKKVFESLGLKIMNYPMIKEGYSPKVTMATVEQAHRLVKMVKVQINGNSVDIRPHEICGEA